MTAFYQPVPYDLLYVKAGGPPDDYASVSVYLDGERITEAREANMLQGWVEEYVVDSAGHAVLKDGKFLTRRRHGIVVCKRENG